MLALKSLASFLKEIDGPEFKAGEWSSPSKSTEGHIQMPYVISNRFNRLAPHSGIDTARRVIDSNVALNDMVLRQEILLRGTICSTYLFAPIIRPIENSTLSMRCG